MHRLRRLPDPPHRIARGIAIGVFVCFTPFFGFHLVIATILVFLIQANLLAALLATFFGNPLTFPVIAIVSLELGQWMLGAPGDVHLPQVFAEFTSASVELWRNITALFTNDVAQWRQLCGFFWRVFWPYLVGGLIPGIITGTVAYILALSAVTAYQKHRIRKLKERYSSSRMKLKTAPDPAEKQ